MNLKRLSALLLIGCFAQHFSIAESPFPDPSFPEFSLSELHYTVIQIVCTANQEQPVWCQSINKLKEVEEQYWQEDGVLNDLKTALATLHALKTEYIKESCAQNPVASHMIHTCESLNHFKRYQRIVKRVESRIERKEAKQEQLSSQIANLNQQGTDQLESEIRALEDKIEELEHDIEGIQEDDLYPAEDIFDKAETEWRAIEKVTMEVACELQDGPVAFCNILDEVKEQQEVFYSIKEELEKATKIAHGEIENHIHALCGDKAKRSSYYYDVICNN